jgi:hypothetical protein
MSIRAVLAIALLLAFAANGGQAAVIVTHALGKTGVNHVKARERGQGAAASETRVWRANPRIQ